QVHGAELGMLLREHSLESRHQHLRIHVAQVAEHIARGPAPGTGRDPESGLSVTLEPRAHPLDALAERSDDRAPFEEAHGAAMARGDPGVARLGRMRLGEATREIAARELRVVDRASLDC